MAGAMIQIQKTTAMPVLPIAWNGETKGEKMYPRGVSAYTSELTRRVPTCYLRPVKGNGTDSEASKPAKNLVDDNIVGFDPCYPLFHSTSAKFSLLLRLISKSDSFGLLTAKTLRN